VKKEVRDACSSRSSSSSSSSSNAFIDTSRMIMLDACITETLRLTSGSMIMRKIVSSNTAIKLASGTVYKFRKGDQVGICPPLVHLDDEIYPDAQAFRPARWLQPAETWLDSNPPKTYLDSYLHIYESDERYVTTY